MKEKRGLGPLLTYSTYSAPLTHGGASLFPALPVPSRGFTPQDQ
jgi:hypothetical protein